MKANFGSPGIRARADERHRRGGQRPPAGQQLVGDIVAEVRFRGGAGRDETARHRDQQRRDGGDQALADGQDGVGLGRGRQVDAVLQDADDEAGDDVDDGDEDGRQRVALGEADRAVHRAVEVGFTAHPVAAQPRLGLVDGAGVEVGVDGHLPARHGVEGEARRHFRDADGAVVDDDELNRDEDQEHDDADDEVAADDELAERHDDVAGRLDAFVPVHEDEARGGDVERQAQQREQEQQRREDRELDRVLDVDDGQQQHHRQRDVDREQQVEQQRRQRHDHQHDDRQQGDRHEQVGGITGASRGGHGALRASADGCGRGRRAVRRPRRRDRPEWSRRHQHP